MAKRNSGGTNIASETLWTRRLSPFEDIPGCFVLDPGDEFGTTAVLDRQVAESGQHGYQHSRKTDKKCSCKHQPNMPCATGGRCSAFSPRPMLAPKRPREQGVARLLNQHSDPIQALVGSEKQHRHNVHSEYNVQASFVA